MVRGFRLLATPAVAGRTLVALGTAAYVAAVYGLIVLGGGALTHSPPPNVPLAVLATAAVAVTMEPLRRVLQERLQTLPQDRLVRFASTLSAAVATDEVATRMARLMAEATGARRVEVWVARAGPSGGQDLAGRWPPDAGPIDPNAPDAHTHPVVHGGELLGRLLRDAVDAGQLKPVEQRLVEDLISQMGVAMRTVALSAGLRQRIAETTVRAAELRASRQRIVAASDTARRRLERDVHDGAQQHLVALAVNLSLAATVTGTDSIRAAELIGDLGRAAATALSTLEDLSLGFYPKFLGASGVAAALRAATRTSPVPVVVLDQTERRFPPPVEAAAYFGSLESVQNAVKHAGATEIQFQMRERDGCLVFTVADDGRGFDPAAQPVGTGLANLRDRVESLGGTAEICAQPGAGTTVSGRIPVCVDD